MIRLIQKGRRFFRRGSGEIIGFVCVLPSLVIVMIMIISVIRMSVVKENLEYAAFAACRAAVCCEDGKTAREKAELAAKLCMDTTSAVFKSYDVKLSYGTWKKGNYAKCKVTVNLGKSGLFIGGKKSAEVQMMIERPTDDGLVLGID